VPRNPCPQRLVHPGAVRPGPFISALRSVRVRAPGSGRGTAAVLPGAGRLFRSRRKVAYGLTSDQALFSYSYGERTDHRRGCDTDISLKVLTLPLQRCTPHPGAALPCSRTAPAWPSRSECTRDKPLEGEASAPERGRHRGHPQAVDDDKAAYAPSCGQRAWNRLIQPISREVGSVTTEEYPYSLTLWRDGSAGRLQLDYAGDSANIEIPYRYSGQQALPIMAEAYQIARTLPDAAPAPHAVSGKAPGSGVAWRSSVPAAACGDQQGEADEELVQLRGAQIGSALGLRLHGSCPAVWGRLRERFSRRCGVVAPGRARRWGPSAGRLAGTRSVAPRCG